MNSWYNFVRAFSVQKKKSTILWKQFDNDQRDRVNAAFMGLKKKSYKFNKNFIHEAEKTSSAYLDF